MTLTTQLNERPVDDDIKRRILAAARAAFYVQGFRSVTMDDLAEELGMSKKTLYAHFPSKAALLEALMLDKFRRVEADLARVAAESSADFLAGLHQLLACVQQHTEEIQPPFVRDIQREAPDLFKMVEQRRREVIRQYFGRLLEDGRKQGLIRKDIPVHLVIEILLGAVQAIINPAKLTELGLTPATGFSAIISAVFDGVVNPKRKPQTRASAGGMR